MKHKVVCIGAMLVDELFYCNKPVITATSNPAAIKRSAGGVMRNIVHHLVLLEIPVDFISVVGNDADGQWLINNCKENGVDLSNIITADCSSGKYTAFLNPDGSLFAAAAVNPTESFLTIALLQKKEGLLMAATVIVADTNLDASVLQWLIAFCRQQGKHLFIDPVSVEKAKKLSIIVLEGLYMVTPNADELLSLGKNQNDAEAVLMELMQSGVQYIWLRKGKGGSEMVSKQNRYNLPSPNITVKDSTGAGDAALAAWIAAFCLGKTERQCLLAAHAMAAAVLQVEGAIDQSINQNKLFDAIKNYYPDEQ
jgi:pseudouridine kinase